MNVERNLTGGYKSTLGGLHGWAGCCNDGKEHYICNPSEKSYQLDDYPSLPTIKVSSQVDPDRQTKKE